MGPTPCPDGDWSALWSTEAGRAEEAWADDSKLGRPTALPWGSFAGAEVVGVYVSELVVHGWDLARATGQDPRFGDATVDAGFAAFRGQMPAEGRQELLDALASMVPEGVPVDLPFDLAEPAPTAASRLDHLVAWSGRAIAWQPA